MGFLVLTRSEGEAIQIGEDVRIVVGKIRTGEVKLLIEAPRHVAVDRSEIADRKRAETQDVVGRA